MRMNGAARTSDALGYYEPSLTHQLLKGCPCGTPHPIALRAANTTICPNCGRPSVPPSAPVTTRAVLTGAPLARLLLWIGRQLAKLARSI